MPEHSYKKNLFRNVAFNWAAQFIQVISGFVIPRLIGDHIGKESLGTWDFAWSIVSYFNLLQLNSRSAISRFVAKHNAESDHEKLNQLVSSSLALFIGLGLVGLALGIIIPLALYGYLYSRQGELAYQAAWIIFILSIYISIRTALSPFAAILTGHHKWDIHNGIFVVANLIAFVAMFTTLQLGGNLILLAAVYTTVFSLSMLIRAVVTIRRYPHIKYSPRLVNRHSITRLMQFTGKTLLPSAGNLFAHQGVNILVMLKLGPAAIAVYARPDSLLKHLLAFLNRYAMIFVPSSSELKGKKDFKSLRAMTLTASQYGNLIALPAILALSILGSDLIEVWMGADYRLPGLAAVLVLGSAFEILYQPLRSILTGINRHGYLGLMSLLGSALSFLFAYLALFHLGYGLLQTALVVVTPNLIVNGVILPVLACRALELRLTRFFLRSWLKPLALAAPFAFCLLALQYFLTGSALENLLYASLAGGISLGVTYWIFVLPPKIKRKLIALMPIPR